ncbi:uncharacterized protein [Drosophila kikkawai]|uniref:PiggyBac transposable element-derived protein domain-containing protein n=1 Tax=Drosophila kikkawai TaxID=30033 RepID=A0A6P4HVR2_DROKI|nr:uncharacterized protein LOC108072925 [Drosophila kikkawai]
MNCPLDEELLANIKCSDQEDAGDEEEKMQMQVEEQLPQLPEAQEAYEDDADPLQETAGSCRFSWIFEDGDVLISDEQLAETVLKSEGSVRPGVTPKRGRGRPSHNAGHYTSSTGQIWSVSKDPQVAAGEELPLLGQQACGKGPARSVSNAVEAWMLLFDDEMLKSLLRHTNEQMRKKRNPTGAQRPLDIVELRSFLGLSYLCGVFRNAQYRGELEELWTLELGNAIFRASMTLARFESISECLSGPSGGWSEAQKLWQRLLINCRSYYGCSSWLNVDEVSGTVAKNRLTLCCDARTLYMTNALVSSRQQRSLEKDVEHLICDFKTTSRNVTLGLRHLTLPQSEQLMQRQLSSLGVLEATSPEWPRQWQCDSLVYSGSSKLIPLDGEAVFCCGLSPQVDALQAYQNTSQACQQFYELTERFSTAHMLPSALEKQSNSFLQLLHFVLNVAAVNAWILLRLSPKGDATMEQRDFQRQLGLFLTQQRLQRRLQRRSTTTSLVMRLQICEILGQSSQRLLSEATGDAKRSDSVGVLTPDKVSLPVGVNLSSRYGAKHRRCKPCARSKRGTKSRTRCQQCQSHRCGNHLISRCYECVGILPSQLPEGNMRDDELGH